MCTSSFSNCLLVISSKSFCSSSRLYVKSATQCTPFLVSGGFSLMVSFNLLMSFRTCLIEGSKPRTWSRYSAGVLYGFPSLSALHRARIRSTFLFFIPNFRYAPSGVSSVSGCSELPTLTPNGYCRSHVEHRMLIVVVKPLWRILVQVVLNSPLKA